MTNEEVKRLTKEKPKVYVAGKLNDKAVGYLQNVSLMMETAEVLRRVGFSVFVPSLDLLMGIKFAYKSYKDYFENSQPWLGAADAVFLCPGWKESVGTNKEINLANKLGIPVFENIVDIKKYFNL